MTDFEIRPESLEFTDILNQYQAFIESQPDETAWKDFFDGSAGSILTRILAMDNTFIRRDIIANKRENYLRYAKAQSSVIGIAGNLDGYSPYRGKNYHLRLRLLVNQNVTLETFDIIGNVGDYDLVSLGNYNLNQGQLQTIDCVIGNFKQSFLIAEDESLDIFRFFVNNVSEDIRLFIDNIEVTNISKNIKDLDNDYWIGITNVVGGIDFFYLNEGIFNYSTLSTIKLEYIEFIDPELFDLDFPTDVKCFYGEVQPLNVTPTEIDTQILSYPVNFETKESIVIKAPLHSETQNIIRGREDFRKVFLLLNPDFTDTTGKDISPAFINLSYIKNDLSFLTTTEKNNYQTELNKRSEYGVYLPPEAIIDPKQVNYILKLELKSLPSKVLTGIDSDIQEIFDYVHDANSLIEEESRIEKRQKKFPVFGEAYQIDLESIERELNNLEQIKIARVNFWAFDYEIEKTYIRGDFIKLNPDNGKIYECLKGGVASSTIPSFTDVENSVLAEEGNQWLANESYNTGDIVLPTVSTGFAYKALNNGTSNITEPNWSLVLGNITVDNNIEWQTIAITDLDTVIWKCHNADIRQLSIEWNEYILLSYGTEVIWL